MFSVKPKGATLFLTTQTLSLPTPEGQRGHRVARNNTSVEATISTSEVPRVPLCGLLGTLPKAPSNSIPAPFPGYSTGGYTGQMPPQAPHLHF